MAAGVRPLHVMMLTWEYPPKIVGGLGRHVAALSRNLVDQGHRVTVVTRGHDMMTQQPDVRWEHGVEVVRVPDDPAGIDFGDLVPWALAFNHRVVAAAGAIIRRQRIDVVHAHDWLVAHAAIGLADAWDLPLAATIHATEHGRHQGHLPGPVQQTIHRIEHWLANRAELVITCSRYMRRQVTELFGRYEGVIVVPNGVAVEDFALSPQAAAAYRQRLTGPRTRMMLFAGRLEYEKGVQTLLSALVEVRARVGPTVCFVAGVGSYSDMLRQRVTELGLRRYVRFTGFLGDDDLRGHYAAADVAVAPSIYEPFGLVAVEAMACGTPVVVSDTGGLAEIVADGAGLLVPPNDPSALADRLVEVLSDAALARQLVAQGHQRIAERFNWAQVATRTAISLRALADDDIGTAGRSTSGGSVTLHRPVAG